MRNPPPRTPEQVLRDGSLRGTTVDGGVQVGFAGHIRPDPALRRLFDYYLTLLGETDLDGVRQLLQEDLQRRPLDAGQIGETMDLFARYTRYLQARSVLARMPAADLRERLRQDRALRVRMLGAGLADAFFPDAVSDDRRLLALLDHRNEGDRPTPAAGAAGQSAAPAASADSTGAGVASAVQSQTARLDAAGASAEQRDAARTARWGKAAADRLAQLDRQRSQWRQRLADYAAAVRSLDQDATLTPDQRRRAAADLLNRRFDGPQRQQVQAMSRAGLLDSVR